MRRTARWCRGIAAAHGLDVDVELRTRLPGPWSTTSAEAEFAAATAAEVFGEQRYQWLANPKTGSEDMSFVLEKVPGAYLNLGACPTGPRPGRPRPTNHSANAMFDDAVVADGSALLAELAFRGWPARTNRRRRSAGP